MKTVCNTGLCTGCKACISICPRNAINYIDLIDHTECVVDEGKCIRCGKCYRVCQSINCVAKTPPQIYFQAWAEDRIRLASSSGGIASAIMEGFVKNGGYVCSCVFEAGEFIFTSTNQEAEIKKYSGSKYVKSNPENAYRLIEHILSTNNKALFIGLPCQSAGIQNYFGKNENLYTIDLICHGTPSPLLLKKYLMDSGIDTISIKDIKFREQGEYGIYIEKEKLLPNRVKDQYLSAFLQSIDFTENCYSCNYASLDRVSDLTLGDAWGQLSETSKKGVSLVLCQTSKGQKLLEMAEFTQCDVDIKKAIVANHQLERPSLKHPKYDTFMRTIKKGCSFRHAMFIVDPFGSIKENIKYVLTKMHLFQIDKGTM